MAHYTLGHALLLERLESPFVTQESSNTPIHQSSVPAPGPGDVKLFIALCSRPYPRALRLVASGALAWRLMMVRCPWLRLASAVDEILAYIQAFSHMPVRWEKEFEKTPGSPPLQQVKLTLMSRLGYTQRQALCTPLALAFWDFFGLWELEGKVELTDQDALAAARETIEEAKREALNGNTSPPHQPTTRN